MPSTQGEVVDALRVTLKERDRLRTENRRLLAGATEPIAIVGMACRYPGGVSSPAELWQLLAEGKDAISPFPTDRGWDLERLYDPDPDRPDTSYTREGGFLTGAAEFDAEFFGIAPREAVAMDPQQRLLLEATWQALEDAGIDPASLAGHEAGVFAGVSAQDYTAGMRGPEGELEGYRLTGSATSVASGRIAYALGLQGPAMTVDTACSSSLVTLHLASQALRGGECSLALAGGATVLASPGLFTEFSRQRGLAPDGRCKSFAEAADGVAWAEGVGMLVLERLSDAQRAGHEVLALVKGSAVNQDGASNGLTAPNGPSQERVIRQALANARLTPQDIDAVEAHGTGTTLGDPIEAGALLATYGQDRDEPLHLGSIKSNIGHSVAAAGVAGVIKTVLALREEALPRTLHVDAPSSKVDWEAGQIELLSEQAPWRRGERARRAGVSSFGISGTNAHVILEEAPEPAAVGGGGEAEPDSGVSSKTLSGPIPLVLSAKSEPALQEQAARLGAHLEDNPELDPIDVAHSLATTRSAFGHRAVALGEGREQLLDSLSVLAEGATSSNAVAAKAREGKLAYLLTGQGSQRVGMGAELYASDQVFKESLDQLREAIDPHLDHPLRALLFAEPGGEEAELLHDTTYAQPALFALEVALFRALESRGLRPDLLAGHSVGEIAAAHLAGVLDLADAAKLIAARGKLMGALPSGGAMLAIEATEAQAGEYLQGKEAALSLAAINGPTATVLSGEAAAIEAAQAHWEAQGRKTKRLSVSHAFHSPLIEPMLGEFEALAKTLLYSPPQIPIVSNLTGEMLSPEQATDPAYWVSHVRSPVRFMDGVRALASEGATTFLELGPDPVLTAMAEQCLGEEAGVTLIATLREGRPEADALAGAHASAHAAGAKLDWHTYFEPTGAKRVALPTYPFQRRRYWLSAAVNGADPAAIGQSAAEHPLLGAVVEDPAGEGLTLTGRISVATHPWLADHLVAGNVILPGTAFVELALRTAEEAGAQAIAELILQEPLVLGEQGAVQIQVSVTSPGEEGEREISIHSRAEEEEAEWTLHAQGLLSDRAPEPTEPLAEWPPEGADPIDTNDLYGRLADIGLEYGPAFQGLTAAWQDADDVYAEVSLPEEVSSQAAGFGLHPALLDSALHGLALAGEGPSAPRLPFSWSGISLSATGADALRVKISPAGEEAISLQIADQEGVPIAAVGSLALRAVDPSQLRGQAKGLDGLLGIEWQAAPLAHPPGDDRGDEVEVWRAEAGGAGDARAAREAAGAALEVLQGWLSGERPADARLAILTEGAVAATEGESPDPAQAAIWGLVRSAIAEHPGRFALIDTDPSEASREALSAALALGGAEPQLALREGEVLVGRAVRLAAPDAEAESFVLDPERTVLITGATGGLGALFARHLATEHGARHLLLLSRSGPKAQGAAELRAELGELGARVTIAACDVSDPKQLRALLDAIPAEHPLGAVIHAAGALDDGLLEAMGPAQLEAVFAPKADAAQHLHELTAEAELSAFVLFSSAAGVLGTPGQANYAAANAYLDALAEQRRAEGLPATSIAWGLWRGEGMGAALSAPDLARMARSGIEALPAEQGLALFEAALGADRPGALALGLNRAGLRAAAGAGSLPSLLSGLLRVPKRRPGAAGSLAAKLASLAEPQREGYALELVRAEVAAVLGHGSGAEVDPERAFKELGFDSLAAVELRNRLGAATGLRLAATAVFDYPTCAALAEHLVGEASAAGPAKQTALKAQASDEPIAIVGMACRYPGGVSSPEGLWRLVASGADAISEFPTDRGWDVEALYDPDPDTPATSYVREGGFLHEAGEFDAEFFGIAPREALAMDPQQRLLLEATWQALEDAGIDPTSLQGDEAGVFAGVMHHDYAQLATKDLEGYIGTGGAGSVASGRIAYALGLQGPAMTVDTACSSSLVTLHLASQALRGGECSLALAGGVTVMATPGVFTEFSRQRGLAPDGRSKSFAEAADGVAWAEGVGMLVLERLSDAQRAGHRVLALLKGSAVNQDGASNGLTAPNGPAQERVIRQALANARLTPQDIDAVEAHGTGTTLGDPIEAGALLATYGQERDEPLLLGSIKSNIGHTQAAAGVAGVIKMTMALREGTLPRTLHVDAPSSKVDWEAGQIELLSEAREWKAKGKPRRAGISSFGISGTNAHLILEEAPQPEPSPAEQGQEGGGAALPGPVPLVLSAKSEPALRDSAARLASHLRDNPELDPTDVAYSLATTRSSFEHRAVALGEGREQLLDSLAVLAEGASSANALSAKAHSGKLAYLFSGQGSQRAGMGAELGAAYPAYAEALAEVCEALSGQLGEDLEEIVFAAGKGAQERLDDTTYAQPALFATEVALYRLLESLGLKPDLLAGHSVGEIAAAHIAGVLDLADAAKLIAARGKLMGALPSGGAMLAVAVAEQEASEYLAGREATLSLAAINGPASVVLSGAEEEIEAADAHWQGLGKRTKRLAVSHAFHSPLIEPMLGEFEALAKTLLYSPPQIPIVSNLTGELLSPEQATDPAYWVSHARSAVRFMDSLATLRGQGATAFLEVGPGGALVAMAQECLDHEQDHFAVLPLLRKDSAEVESISRAIASAHAAGAKLDWHTYFKGAGAKRVALPTYPFQRRRYWLSAAAGAGDPGAVGQSAADHPLLGAAVEIAGSEGEGLLLTGRISLATHPWLADHTVAGAVLLPGTAFVELALRAAEEAGAQAIAELTLQAPLVLGEQGAVQIQVSVTSPGEEGEREIAIHSRAEEEEAEWTLHAQGLLGEEIPQVSETFTAWPPEGADPIDTNDLYGRLADIGLEYGPAFQGLTAAWQDGDDLYAEVSLPEELSSAAQSFGLHPALLDAALHAAALAGPDSGQGALLPFSWSGVSLQATGADALRVKISPRGEEAISLQIADRDGVPIAAVGSLTLRAVDPSQLRGQAKGLDGLLGIEWQAAPLGAGQGAEGEVELWRAEAGGAGDARAAREAAGAALEVLQGWLSGERPADARLAILTEGAVAATEGESPDPAQAAIWGLVRSAIAEHPGRFALIDTDPSEASREALSAALALGGAEPQLALREGEVLVGRAVRLAAPDAEAESFVLDPERTVLITGATGGLGALFARHLATEHGARHLLLLSRSGPKAQGAAELRAELGELGARVTIAACDVSDPKQLRALLDAIPAEHPLGAVIHAAGALDDGLLEAMGPAQLEAVFAPKADAAQHLHELTAEAELSAFVLFSSAAGVLGTPGQANYAAANAYLDALAGQRRAQGLPATSIAWGLWRGEGMGAALSAPDLARMARSGIEALPAEQGLALFEAALATERPNALALGLNRAGLRAAAGADSLPSLLSGLLRVPKRRPGAAGSLATKLAELAEPQREGYVLELVRAEVAAVLGHGSGAEVDPERAFKELGFDSLAAVELRNRLGAATGLRLAATAVFDYPTCAALAEHLVGEASAAGPAKQTALKAQASDEPIAIVGMACRYPGGVSSPEGLWRLVASGADAISEFPTDRGWDVEALYDPDPDTPATSYVREGGFLHEAGEFDAEFFGIAPREALAMDPQQRLLLEATWQALEDAGIDPTSLQGDEAGVFAGVMHHDYAQLATKDLEGYIGTGGAGSVASGRIAYALGLQGPAMTVDTACSSSLVTLHLASQALRGGECSLALAGGVTVMATPGVFTEFSRQRGLAPDGRSKSFAEAADGVAWAEGVGMLVLERLSDAQRAGHRVLALLKGSAVNQDGASNGLTAPNGPAQERVIRQALANARLTPQDIDAVEAHGTGTTLGDPIEAGALLATYGQERDEPLLLGSIKSNIGHTQAAAGVAGVIKMTMALREGTLPRTLHVDAPSSKVDWEAGQIELLSEAREWKAKGKPRRAGISSFGISGTNAHLILEEAPQPEPSPAEQGQEGGGAALPGPVPLVLSAKSEPALRDSAARLASHLRDNPELDPTDVAYSLATTRSSFEHRAVALGEGREQLLDSLAVLAEGASSSNAIAAQANPQRPVFLFPGQGSQWEGMALELIEASPSFAAHMAECEQALSSHVDWSLTEVLAEEGGAWMDRLDIVQPALFAVMISLAKLWQGLGVQPSVVVGHSQGEIAAAHVAGALSLGDAALIVAERGKAMARIAGQGAMLSVSLTLADLKPLLEPYGDRISIAAINGPASLALSGEPEALTQLMAECKAEGVRTQPIAVDYAAHSSQIDALKEQLLEAFAPISPRSGEIPMHSTLTGEQIEGTELDASYWFSNLRQTVLLEPVIASLFEAGQRTFIEIGPHPVLAFALQESAEAHLPDTEQATVLGTLRRDEGGPTRFALSLAQAHAAGVPVEWEAFFKGTGAKRVTLPTYPFQRRRYWIEASQGSGDLRSTGLASAEHPLLSAVVEDPRSEALTLTGRISLATHPWLADHAVAGNVILPGTAFLELALKAAEEVGAAAVAELTLQAPLVLREQGAVQIQVSVTSPEEDGEREIQIHSRPDEEGAEWTHNAQGLLSEEASAAPEPIGTWPPEGAEPIETDDVYERFADIGVEYGPAFQGLTAAWRQGAEIYAEVSLSEELSEQARGFAVHPALLDAALHGIGLLEAEDLSAGDGPLMPFAWGGVSLQGSGAGELRVRLGSQEGSVSLSAFGPDGTPIARIDSLAVRPVETSQLQAAGRGPDGLLEIEWQQVSLAPADEDAAGVELWRSEAGGGSGADAALRAAQAALAAVQTHLSGADSEQRLAILTEGALAATEGESPDPAQAAIWGLVRSAQSEHPGRFALIDSDGGEASEAALGAALAAGAQEPQLALRGGEALAGRAVRLPAPAEQEDGERSLDPDRTVLITGATGGLGAIHARYLAAEHGARQLLLVSRSGPTADGAEELQAELEDLGAEVTIAACDVSDREQLEELLDSIPAEHPLGAVIHAAGVLADGLIEAMEPAQLGRVFAPKANAAQHLHELTAQMDLSAFVLFSSAAAVFGGPGHANYAAANAYLDALATRRRAEGLPATAIAWGLWETESEIAAALGQADLARLTRTGIVALAEERGLSLFDEAIRTGRPAPIALALDRAGLRSAAQAGSLPPLLSGLVRVPRRRQAAADSLAARLAALSEGEREGHVLELVRSEVAAVLGHASVTQIDPGRTFKDLGFDSLAAVELRNMLGLQTGLRLPATVVFDYPSPDALVAYLLGEARVEGSADGSPDTGSVEAEFDRLESILTRADSGDLRDLAATRLRELLAGLEPEGPGDLDEATDEEMFEHLDRRLGQV